MFVYLVGVVTVDVRLCHQREGDTVVKLAEGGDAAVVLGFLTTKLRSRQYQTISVYCDKRYLVAWEAKDNKTLVL